MRRLKVQTHAALLALAVPLAAGASQGPPADAMAVRGLADLWVYIAWLWVVIAALVGVLILRIREADRLHRLSFHQPARAASPGSDPS